MQMQNVSIFILIYIYISINSCVFLVLPFNFKAILIHALCMQVCHRNLHSEITCSVNYSCINNHNFRCNRHFLQKTYKIMNINEIFGGFTVISHNTFDLFGIYNICCYITLHSAPFWMSLKQYNKGMLGLWFLAYFVTKETLTTQKFPHGASHRETMLSVRYDERFSSLRILSSIVTGRTQTDEPIREVTSRIASTNFVHANTHANSWPVNQVINCVWIIYIKIKLMHENISSIQLWINRKGWWVLIIN